MWLVISSALEARYTRSAEVANKFTADDEWLVLEVGDMPFPQFWSVSQAKFQTIKEVGVQ